MGRKFSLIGIPSDCPRLMVAQVNKYLSEHLGQVLRCGHPGPEVLANITRVTDAHI